MRELGESLWEIGDNSLGKTVKNGARVCRLRCKASLLVIVMVSDILQGTEILEVVRLRYLEVEHVALRDVEGLVAELVGEGEE